MKGMKLGILDAALLAAGMLGGTVLYGQAPSTTPTTPPPASDKDKGQAAIPPLTLDAAQPPVNAEEDVAMKAFRDVPLSEMPKKLQMADEFLAKYPQSRYRVELYSWQVKGYMALGQIDKMQAAGEKELELKPDDPQTLAILGSTLPRSISGSMTAEQRQLVLSKAEEYSKKALELVPTLTKPDGITDEQFLLAKNQVQSMAYGGLGLVAFRRGKYTDAIPNLEQAERYDPTPDPVNYLVLGISNEKASHFEDAIKAFTKCAEIQGSLQATCKAGIEEAKKLSTTQLSVPK